MKTIITGSIFHITIRVFIFFFVLLLSCASTSVMRLEGSEFKENLPGLWEGEWRSAGFQGKTHIKIIKIDGNKVQLTGFSQGSGISPDTDEVYGHIEDSKLLLTWPQTNYESILKMKRDDSNNLILDGYVLGELASGTRVQLKKIE